MNSDRYGQMPQTSSHPGSGGIPPSHFLNQPNQPQYSQHAQGYPNSTSAPSFPQRTLAPALPRDQQSAAYPPPNYTQAEARSGAPNPWNGGDAMSNAAADSKDPARHVVGQQGRRGILPSAPGRPAVAPNAAASPGSTSTAKNAAIPTKDADGKFPCPNCTKTYLHAKHLKRHMLRHTGDRPYMCVLCKDTFSRSDILKRHFQKCSVRRGNPTGASHLSNPAAHLKKNQAAANKAAGASISSAETTPNQMTAAYGQTSMGGPIATTTSAYPDATSISNAPTHTPASSMGRSDEVYGSSGAAPYQNWQQMNTKQHNPMLFHPNSSSPDHFAVSSSSEDKRSILAAAPAHHGEGEWMYAGGQEQYLFPTSMSNGYDSMTAHTGDVKKDFDGHEPAQGNYYMPSTSFGADGTLGPGPLLWATAPSHDDLVQIKANQLVDFCFPGGLQESLQEQELNAQIRVCLTADNIKHFLSSFTNWQGHFPYLHLPTFDFTRVYDGLILSIVCMGAVYSDQVSVDTVRVLIQRTKQGITRTSHLYQELRDANLIAAQSLPILSLADLEQLQACLMLQVLSIWHGGPEERATARADCPMWSTLVHRYRMLETTEARDGSYSSLHNLRAEERFDPAHWDWESWIEQEKRLRLLYFIYLFDAALCVWFNCVPSLDPAEIRLPLPSDDAAWEAKTSEECAQALGIRGPEIQASVNLSGSRRQNQLQLHHFIATLLDTTVELPPRTTNVYSKFILIHVLLVQTWKTHQHIALGISDPPSKTFDPATGQPSAQPLLEASLQRNTTPDNRSVQVAEARNFQVLQIINSGLARFKHIWDQDMVVQYPPHLYATNPIRRIGFCRDGNLFYWLAKCNVQLNRSGDLRLAPDQRFLQVMNLLKQARKWAQSDAAQRGEEAGSANEAVKDYPPVSALILDMKKLFRPLSDLIEEPRLGTKY
ncbi:MAG: hypothetical protein Q9227_002880 [Pyrenula ochraceoflavens]